MAKTKLLGSDKEKKVKAKEKEQKQLKKKKLKSPARFFKEIYSELKKVTWPTPKDLITYTLAVITFILLMGVITYGIDLGFNQLLLMVTTK
jgi:preprotein translocase subunit SecE